MPKLLTQLKKDHCGHPCELTDEQWEKILSKMIICFTEANEDTCTKVNKYQKDYNNMWGDFNNQYGYFGEQLPQPKDGSTRMYTPSDEEIGKKYWQKITNDFMKEEEKIDAYRNKKLQEGLELFKKYFWNLWD